MLSGLAVIALGCVATLYSTYFNQRFIHDPIDLLYYFRYIILLGGGFITGYLFTKKPGSYSYDSLFAGIAYALLAVSLFLIIDTARAGLENSLGQFPYPWGKLVFMGTPLLSVAVALFAAYLLQHRPNRPEISTPTKQTLIVTFILYHAYLLISSLYYLTKGATTYDPTTPLWLIVCGYLISPLAIMIISYLFLIIGRRIDRLFYAVCIGALYSVLTFILWEFRTVASYEATTIFGTVVTTLALGFTGVLLWRMRKAAKA